jgi:hypothetical protein
MTLTASQYHLLVISVIYFVILIPSIILVIYLRKKEGFGIIIPALIIQWATILYLCYLTCWVIYNWDRWHFPSLTPSFIHVIN